MPSFCYTNRQGDTIERVFRMGRARKSVVVDGVRYQRNIPAEWGTRRGSGTPWPMKSDALGVLHNQVDEASEHLLSVGVPTSFTDDGTGRCIVESRQHRNQIMAALGMHDRDAGYGDRARP